MDKHLALYNLTTHEVDYIESYPDDAKEDLVVLKHGYDSDGKPTKKEKKIGEFFVWEQRKRALEQESLCRGSINGEWMVYTGHVPFSWNLIGGMK